MGDHPFYGRHGGFTIDSTKEATVVTQFITSDGTDSGDLVDIIQFYVQDGVVIPHSNSSIAGVTGSSITNEFCSQMKKAFGDINDFAQKGGLKAMGEALDRGMVLVLSLWDDSLANMLWLDSDYPTNVPPSTPGVARGPCRTTTGKPEYLRAKYPSASVQYTRLAFGAIGSTQAAETSGGDDEFGDDRRLQGALHI
jgi:cellulose 1,4-beta-cellobiosidase